MPSNRMIPLLTDLQQGGTAQDPISAFQAAIDTDTTLLLGLWASSGEATIDAEIAALKTAITTLGTKFTSLVAGISVGSEDLYRISPTGILNKSNPGANPADLVSYIQKVRQAIAGTSLSGAKIGHVDTWTAWVNGSNADVISNCDWLGVDAYPYFQNTQSNGIESGEGLFFDAYDATVAVAGGKDVWITETGWPVSGKTENLAVASTDNAKTYWDEVGCAKSFGKINTFWFTLQDSYPTTPNPSVGITSGDLKFTPQFDLSCDGVSAASVSTSSVASGSTDNVILDSSSASETSSTTSATSKTVTLATPTGDTGLSPTQGGNGGAGAGSNTSFTVSATATTTATGSGSGSVGTGVAGSSGIVTSTTVSNGTAPTAGSPSASPSATTVSGNSAASFNKVGAMGTALAAVCVLAALL
jgi:glucan endo-1,3-beta-D-glucosidase